MTDDDDRLDYLRNQNFAVTTPVCADVNAQYCTVTFLQWVHFSRGIGPPLRGRLLASGSQHDLAAGLRSFVVVASRDSGEGNSRQRQDWSGRSSQTVRFLK